jgi:hypothetical protein
VSDAKLPGAGGPAAVDLPAVAAEAAVELLFDPPPHAASATENATRHTARTALVLRRGWIIVICRFMRSLS